MNKFIKVITASGNIVWINTHNIVSIEESKKNPDAFEVITNGVDLDGETKRYLVEGSPEVFLSSIEASVEYFS